MTSRYRPWHLRWGSTDAEVHEPLPGDEVVDAPTFAATRAVTIEATPEAVWPWIVQLGFDRAGWYSYDLLDNLGHRSAVRIDQSLQNVRVGDLVPLGPGGGGLYVKDLDPGRWLLWGDKAGHTTWLWYLEPVGSEGSRLRTRVRTHYRWTHPTILFSLLLVEPFDFPMMRKCMLGIKQRAETVPHSGVEA
ncbi:hypothetical protein AB0L70_29610 [Kribbella sp. NPDC051952]|uniref:hypothetical protein n=1 Tax=Kribbella sp. NPDC051952 TaxID=3154851 RepID=UPI00341CF509